jgi:hypothetical protein
LFGEGAFDGAGGKTDDDVLKFSEAAIANEFACEAEITIAALLAADLQNAFVVANGFHEAFAFIDRQCQRLLGVNVFACFEGEQINESVPMIGRAGDDRMDIVALHQLAKIIILLGRLAVFCEPFGSGVRMCIIHIANSDNVAKALGGAAISGALAAATDKGNAGPIVCRKRFGRCSMSLIHFNEPGRNASSRSDGSGRFQKTTTIDLKGMRFHWVGFSPGRRAASR